MEENSSVITTKFVGIRYGLFTSLTLIIFFLALAVMGMSMSGRSQIIDYPIYIMLVVLAHQYFKENNSNGYMSYGQGINIAYWLAVVCSIIYSAFTYVYIKFIDDRIIEVLREKQIGNLQESGISGEQLTQAIRITEVILKPESLFFFGILGGIVSIVMMALIVTIFTQKRNPDQVF